MNYRRVFIKNGLAFLTIVTNDRIPILTDNIKLLNQFYNNVIKYYKFDLIAYSILPEHIHCIIKPTIIEEYSKIVKSFKYSFTKNYNVGLVNPTYITEWDKQKANQAQFIENKKFGNILSATQSSTTIRIKWIDGNNVKREYSMCGILKGYSGTVVSYPHPNSDIIRWRNIATGEGGSSGCA